MTDLGKLSDEELVEELVGAVCDLECSTNISEDEAQARRVEAEVVERLRRLRSEVEDLRRIEGEARKVSDRLTGTDIVPNQLFEYVDELYDTLRKKDESIIKARAALERRDAALREAKEELEAWVGVYGMDDDTESTLAIIDRALATGGDE